MGQDSHGRGAIGNCGRSSSGSPEGRTWTGGGEWTAPERVDPVGPLGRHAVLPRDPPPRHDARRQAPPPRPHAVRRHEEHAPPPCDHGDRVEQTLPPCRAREQHPRERRVAASGVLDASAAAVRRAQREQRRRRRGREELVRRAAHPQPAELDSELRHHREDQREVRRVVVPAPRRELHVAHEELRHDARPDRDRHVHVWRGARGARGAWGRAAVQPVRRARPTRVTRAAGDGDGDGDRAEPAAQEPVAPHQPQVDAAHHHEARAHRPRAARQQVPQTRQRRCSGAPHLQPRGPQQKARVLERDPEVRPRGHGFHVTLRHVSPPRLQVAGRPSAGPNQTPTPHPGSSPRGPSSPRTPPVTHRRAPASGVGSFGLRVSRPDGVPRPLTGNALHLDPRGGTKGHPSP